VCEREWEGEGGRGTKRKMNKTLIGKGRRILASKVGERRWLIIKHLK
jgi:hypothetical protein